MYSNMTKRYYTNIPSTTCYSPYNMTNSTGNGNDSPFINIANTFVKYYTSNNIINFTNLIPKLTILEKTYPNYKNNKISSTIVNLIDSLTSLLNVNMDLKKQLEFLENHDLCERKKDSIFFNDQIIKQNVGINLVYTQYLLMYNISATNGIFTEEYLNNARELLNSNNGKLVTNQTVIDMYLNNNVDDNNNDNNDDDCGCEEEDKVNN